MSYSERTLKQLLLSYFENFQEKTLLDFCEKVKISTRRIPQSYRQEADLIQLVKSGALSTDNFAKEKVIYLPLKDKKHKFAYLDEIYYLYLDLVPGDTKWNEEFFTKFGDHAKEIKIEIGNLLNSVHYTLFELKKNNEELETLSLEPDTQNITLKLRDSRIPKYIHPQRIGWKIVKKDIANQKESNLTQKE